jgi:27-O-demethylrifamycin SV methyltransferase
VESYDPAGHYDQVTEAWTLLLGDDLHYGLFERGDESLPVATAALTDRMVEVAGIAEGSEVLDVGCGTGSPACLLGEMGARVVGITTSAVGVEASTERSLRAGLSDRVRFEVRDGMDNGFPDASFDRVWVLESSHLMRDRRRLMAECARVLRPGGRLALCDIMLQRPMPFEEVRRLREPLKLLRQVYGDARMELMGSYSNWAQECALSVKIRMDLTEGTRPTFSRWRDNAEQHRREVVGELGVDGWRKFVDSLAILEGFWDDGTLGYGLLAATKGP